MFTLQSIKYKRRLLLGAASLLLVACGENVDNSETAQQQVQKQPEQVVENLASIRVQNPSDYARKDQAVFLKLADLGLQADADSSRYSFLREDKAVPHQFIDSDGDGAKDEAVLLVDLAAGETTSLQLSMAEQAAASPVKRTHAEIGVKVGGRWNEAHYEGGVFEDVESVTLPPQYTDHSEYLRYEGPGIESDLVGYRVYLDWRNGFDIFGKKQKGLHLAEVGLDGYHSYHENAEWGMDVLKVGKSVGMGGFGLWENGAITRVSNVDSWSARIVEDGDLYSAFAIDYDGWDLGERSVDVDAQLAMVAGSPLVNVTLKTDPGLTQLAVGIVKHEGTQLLRGNIDITGEAWSYLATLGPQALDGQPLAMFVLFKRETLVDFAEDEHNQALILKVRGGELNYYFGAQWAGEQGADLSIEAVQSMLEKQVERLTYPPRLAIENQKSQALKQQLGGTGSALRWAKMAASSEMKRSGQELAYGQFDSMRQREANWEYTMGLLTQPIYQLGKATDDKAMADWAQGIIDSYVTEDGELRTYNQSNYNIDSINSGKFLLQLYNDTGEEKYRLAAAHLREQLKHHPKLDAGAFWHKQRYPYQLWLDGVYMGMPFLAQYSAMFEDGASLEEVVHEFHVVRDNLRDPETGLYWHAWDEKRQQNWADSETGLSHYFWARGIGWLAMALVDTLDFVPQERGEMRAYLIDMTRELADTLLKFQDDNGVWHQIIDMPGKTGNYAESSASAMFTYMLVKGVKNGILPESYGRAATRAYDALIEEFALLDANDSLQFTQACQVGGLGFGRDGSYEYYMSEPVIYNDPKALGPFILASLAAGQTFGQ